MWQPRFGLLPPTAPILQGAYRSQAFAGHWYAAVATLLASFRGCSASIEGNCWLQEMLSEHVENSVVRRGGEVMRCESRVSRYTACARSGLHMMSPAKLMTTAQKTSSHNLVCQLCP